MKVAVRCARHPYLYNSKFWKGDDKRRNLVLYRASDDYYFCDKYQNPQTREEYAPILRYAEVLLTRPRLPHVRETRLSPLEKLNQVRDRSLADPATQTYKAGDFANTKALVEAILWERRIEFQGEGRRWEDIHRLAADELTAVRWYPRKDRIQQCEEPRRIRCWWRSESRMVRQQQTVHPVHR